jgi:uncharacterized protein YigA (DUF484 family)
MANENDVTNYLAANPDFLARHPELLETLVVPHGTGDAAVSLVERQVKVLRERQAVNRERLADLLRVARGNDELAARIHSLTLRLLRARDRAAIEQQLATSLREDFGIEAFRLLGTATAELETLLASGQPRCGHFAPNQRALLFGAEADSIASMALIPIGAVANRGVLALGSAEASRFNPGMSTDFLARIGELITAALARCSPGPHE